jgi:hypothetical protein
MLTWRHYPAVLILAFALGALLGFLHTVFA